MSDEWKNALLEQISASVPIGRQPALCSVVVGQVRKLRSYDDDLDSMLVLVIDVDGPQTIATVTPVRSPISQATDRDIVLDRAVTGFPFDLYVMVDCVAKVWTVQLSDTSVVGDISRELVSLVSNAQRHSTLETCEQAEQLGAGVGSLVPQVGDHLWWDRGRIAEHLAHLSDACRESALAPVIADPAIISTLLLRGHSEDWSAALAVTDASEADEVSFSDETWEATNEALGSATAVPDALRWFQSRLMERALRSNFDDDGLPQSTGDCDALPGRSMPASTDGDPLLRLIMRNVHDGQSSTHIWTSPHLWNDRNEAIHIEVDDNHHALIADFADCA